MEGSPEATTTHHGTPGASGVPWCLVGPLGLLLGASLAHWLSSGPKKSPKIFIAIGLRLVLIFYKVKNKQKTTTGTWHYANRLVPINNIKLLQNNCKTTKIDNITAWNKQKL